MYILHVWQRIWARLENSRSHCLLNINFYPFTDVSARGPASGGGGEAGGDAGVILKTGGLIPGTWLTIVTQPGM